jgi:hypothetical protein
MSHFVVVCYDKELKATFKVTPPMLYRLKYGQSLQIVRIVGVAALSLNKLRRPISYWLKFSSLVLLHD